MKIFLDTANPEQIRSCARLGVIDGVTTNPTLLAKETGSWRETLETICRIVPGPISAEVVAEDAEGMVRAGARPREDRAEHRRQDPDVPGGGSRDPRPVEGRIRTNATLIFSPVTGPSRREGRGEFRQPVHRPHRRRCAGGLEVLRQIIEIYEVQDFETEVLAASIRHPMHVVEAALAGLHVATMPVAVFEALFRHPLTDRGIQLFLEDWKKVEARRREG